MVLNPPLLPLEQQDRQPSVYTAALPRGRPFGSATWKSSREMCVDKTIKTGSWAFAEERGLIALSRLNTPVHFVARKLNRAVESVRTKAAKLAISFPNEPLPRIEVNSRGGMNHTVSRQSGVDSRGISISRRRSHNSTQTYSCLEKGWPPRLNSSWFASFQFGLAEIPPRVELLLRD